ncbi:hypothetical protein UZ36_05685 [Candidatus Nitromaritima sp. SCGC AAA799-C22]|nr:hypothetical protein UZ36_05685 [Candidatus Nitromaritima sp. SCGC AAA799-C22]
MRALGKITRRTTLVMGLKALAAFAISWIRPLKARAETDYFTGTDYVGKTRAGRYEKFYINYWKPMRRIRPDAWRLEVNGLCENPRSFSMNDIKDLPVKTQTSRLKCVECWSAKAEWNGFHIAELEQMVKPLPEATGVLFHCADEYIEHLSLESLRHGRTLLAHHMNGEPLTDEHGFPLRVIIPFKYGYKNPKAILKMEYVSESSPGTWSKIGPYSTDGTILPGTDHPLEHDKRPRRIPGGEIALY